MVVRLQRFDEEYKTATFISAIGEEALEIYESMTFNPPESSKVRGLLVIVLHLEQQNSPVFLSFFSQINISSTCIC